MRNRPGMTLAEMLVGLVVASLLGASLIQLMVVQSQFFNRQEGRANARAVSRSATNLMIAELRMVEPTGGVMAASPTSIEFRVPFATGIVCQTSGTTTVMFPPMDSVLWAEGVKSNAMDGYAFLTSSGTYTYWPGSVSFGSASVSDCTGVGLSMVPGGAVVGIAPPAAGTTAGAPFFLYQRIQYSFANSVSVPGQIGLWRTILNRSLTEEVAAPFDSTAKFQFYVAGSNTPQASAPSPLSDLRGVELQLTARNERTQGGGAAELSPLATAVLFKNQ